MSQAHVTHPRRGIPSLDGWRALSIAMVLALHSLQGIHFRLASHTANTLIYSLANGAMGVRIFFVISGYLITRLLLREQERTGRISLSGFYTRRVFRILPPLYLYLGVIVALIAAGRILLSMRYPAYAAAFLTIYANSPDRDFWVLEHTWSLCVEEQFYLLWPFALVWALKTSDVVTRQKRAMRAAAISIIVIVILRIPWYLPPFTALHPLGNAFFQLDGILFGAFAAVAEGNAAFEHWYTRATQRPWVLVVLLFGISSYLENAFPGKYIRTVGAPLDGLLIMWLLLWTVRQPSTPFARWLNWRPVAWVGVLSYSLYLWQTIFLHDSNEQIFDIPYHLPILASIVLVFVAACISFYFVEQPVLRLRDRFLRSAL